jgi:[acyl-carrier-protein] S-malonyltransferase
MFSVLFPGQGSQTVGMARDLHDNFNYIKDLFKEADEALNFSISKLIFEGPKELLNQTENTQPAIFMVSYAIFNIIKKETSFDIYKANFFAGHSLGEYSALACAGVISFEDTIKLLKIRGNAMQNAVPNNEGGMVAVLGEQIKKIEEIILNNRDKFNCFLANDNTEGQVVISGKNKDLDELIAYLKKINIKNVRLPVSAPFHCELMAPATQIMRNELSNIKFSKPNTKIISNVNAEPSDDPDKIKNLLIEQIEKPVRWRETIINMIKLENTKFVEIGPGKVLSGLIKRVNKNVNLIQINNISDLNNLKNND